MPFSPKTNLILAYWKVLVGVFLLTYCQPKEFNANFESIPILDSLYTDQAVRSHILNYKDSMTIIMNTVIGQADTFLSKQNTECSLGNWVVDLMQENASNVTKEEVDLALINIYGLRKELAPGKIKVGDVFELMPFENELWVIEISGKDLLSLLELAALYRHLSFSNLRVRVEGEKLVHATWKGNAIEQDRKYKMIVSDYLAAGGDKLTILKDQKVIDKTGILIRDQIMDHIQMKESVGVSISSKVDGRFLEVNKDGK